MKKLFIIFLISIIALGCTNNTDSLSTILDQSEFTEIEKQDILKLVEFFESQIAIKGKSKKESYETIVMDVYNDYYAISNKISIEKQRIIFKEINSSTYQEIWYETKGRAFVSHDGIRFKKPIPYLTIVAQVDRKYVKLLQTIGKQEPKVAFYANNLRSNGDFPIHATMAGLLLNSKAEFIEDLDQSHWRLIIAIHLLSSNEQDNRYMSISEDD